MKDRSSQTFENESFYLYERSRVLDWFDELVTVTVTAIHAVAWDSRGEPAIELVLGRTNTLFFYKNKVYKNIEAENGKILRIC